MLNFYLLKSLSSFIPVTIAGKEYRAEAPKNKNVEEKVVIAVLSSLTPKDMDHLANLRDVKFKEIKPNFQPESSSVEMITLDDDEESVNQVSSTTEINENSVQENKNNNVETVEKESTACNDYDGFGEYVSRYYFLNYANNFFQILTSILFEGS